MFDPFDPFGNHNMVSRIIQKAIAELCKLVAAQTIIKLKKKK